MRKQLEYSKYSRAEICLPGYIFTPTSNTLVLWSFVAEVLRKINRRPLLLESRILTIHSTGIGVMPYTPAWIFSCKDLQEPLLLTSSNVPSIYLAKASHSGISIIPRVSGTQGFMVLASSPSITKLLGERMAALGLPYFLHKSPSVEAILSPSCSLLPTPKSTWVPRLGLGICIGGQVHFLSVLTQSAMMPVLVGRDEFS